MNQSSPQSYRPSPANLNISKYPGRQTLHYSWVTLTSQTILETTRKKFRIQHDWGTFCAWIMMSAIDRCWGAKLWVVETVGNNKAGVKCVSGVCFVFLVLLNTPQQPVRMWHLEEARKGSRVKIMQVSFLPVLCLLDCVEAFLWHVPKMNCVRAKILQGITVKANN